MKSIGLKMTAAPDNDRHPTRNSAALIIYGSSERVMPGVGR